MKNPEWKPIDSQEWKSQIGTMSGICIELRIDHRVSFSLKDLDAPPTFHVPDGCDRTGWIKILSLKGLLQWIGAKGFA